MSKKEGVQLENYTKYKLKGSDELISLLSDKDNLFIVACNKCFKEFESVDEPDLDEFRALAEEQGKKICGAVKTDFLCNALQTERKLENVIPEEAECIAVISCGLGIQTLGGSVRQTGTGRREFPELPGTSRHGAYLQSV